MYHQNYDPAGNVVLSTILAAIPILTLLYFIALHPHRDQQGVRHLGVSAPYAAFFGVIAFLVWLFFRHRDRYPRIRNVLALTTLTCLLIQLIPVAPPRLVPGLHIVGALTRAWGSEPRPGGKLVWCELPVAP